MAASQMDATTSFLHLIDHVPKWLDQLTNLKKHAAEKNAEFLAEYANIVSKIKPKRIKTPSTQSINSHGSVHLSQIDPQAGEQLPQPQAPVEIDPLEAGNRYLYAQAQKKRKPDGSVRSGASGPQKFRSKHQVIIYYDSHLQGELDSMAKAVGVARNNLRKGRNVLIASRGFQLPALSRRHDTSTVTSTLENIRSQAVLRSSPMLSGKFMLRSSQTPANEDEARFVDADKILEAVQGLYETAAHQFLRDGDCRVELDSANTQLNTVLEMAKATVEVLREKARKEEEGRATEAQEDSEHAQSNSDATLYSKPSTEPLNMVLNKVAPTGILQTVEDIKAGPIASAPNVSWGNKVSSPPTAGMTIEVDDNESDDGSLVDLDITQFRLKKPPRLRG